MLVLSSLITTVGQSQIAYADTASSLCDAAFYAANDINWYNECASTCSTSSSSDSSDTSYTNSSEVTEAVFRYLTSTTFEPLDGPMNAVQAAAFLGNMYQESKYDPSAIQNGKPYDESKAKDASVGAYGFGLIQWDTDRRAALMKYAAEHKSTSTSLEDAWKDITIQMGYLKAELEGSEKAMLTDNEFRAVATADDIEKATLRVRAVYERANEKTAEDPSRVKAAKEMYAKYQDLAPAPVESSSGATSCGGTPGFSGASGEKIAAAAKLLSWTKRAEYGATDHTAQQNKPEYTEALEATGVNKLGDRWSMAGISCDAFVATAVRYSGVDPKFACCGAANDLPYMRDRPDQYTLVTEKVTSTGQLEPGDILVAVTSDGGVYNHVKIYIGDGQEAAASHSERTGEQAKITFEGKYYAFRAK